MIVEIHVNPPHRYDKFIVCGTLDFQGEVCAGDRTAESGIRHIFKVTRNKWVQTACSFSRVTPFSWGGMFYPSTPWSPGCFISDPLPALWGLGFYGRGRPTSQANPSLTKYSPSTAERSRTAQGPQTPQSREPGSEHTDTHLVPSAEMT